MANIGEPIREVEVIPLPIEEPAPEPSQPVEPAVPAQPDRELEPA